MPRARHDFLSFHGAFLSFTGAWLYIFGSAIQLIGSHVQLTQMQKMLFTAAPFLIGAILFTAGGYLMAVEAAHSWTWAFTPPKFGTYESKTPGRWIQVRRFRKLMHGACRVSPAFRGKCNAHFFAYKTAERALSALYARICVR